jgi:hypothetical protein
VYKGMWIMRGFSRVKIEVFCEICIKSGGIKGIGEVKGSEKLNKKMKK